MISCILSNTLPNTCINTLKKFWKVNTKLIIMDSSKEGSRIEYRGHWGLLPCIIEIFMRRIFLELLV